MGAHGTGWLCLASLLFLGVAASAGEPAKKARVLIQTDKGDIEIRKQP